MRDVLSLPDGGRWVEIETEAEAKEVGMATRTAVGPYFGGELAARAKGREPGRYLALVMADGTIPVVGCVAADPASGARLRGLLDSITLMTGYCNKNPYPEHGHAIEMLGNYLGRDLGPHRYPSYRGPDASAEGEDSSPAPR